MAYIFQVIDKSKILMTSNNSKIILALFIIAIIVFIKYLLNSKSIGPIYYFDELIYKVNAESIFESKPYNNLIYPPLYPLILSLAFFSKERWYEWMIFINVVVSTSIIIPVWLISSKLIQNKLVLLVILIIAIWPLNIYYPSLLISENLYVPLFMFSVFLLMHSKKQNEKMNLMVNVLFGATLAMGYLTRYIHAVAIPVFLFLWWIKPFFQNEKEIQKIFRWSRIYEFLVIFATFSIIFIPWLVYASKSGSSIYKAIGSQFISYGLPPFATLNSLMVWLSFYSSYIILVLAPCLMILLIYFYALFSGRLQNEPGETFYFIAVLLFSCVFFATSIQHSWRVSYNYPEPVRLMGRYLMPLVPLYFIAFMLILNKIRKADLRLSSLTILICSLICLTSFLISHYVLFSWPNPDLHFGFTNNPDVAAYGSDLLKYIVLLTIISIPIIYMVKQWNIKYASNSLLIITIISLLIIQIYSSFMGYRSHSLKRIKYASHGQYLSGFLMRDLRNGAEDIVIVSDIHGISAKRLLASFKFWLSPLKEDDSLSVISLSDYQKMKYKNTSKMYLVTKESYGTPLLSYTAGENKYYLHYLNVLNSAGIYAFVDVMN